MAQVTENILFSDSILLSAVFLICLLVVLALLSTSFKASDLKSYFTVCTSKCCCCLPCFGSYSEHRNDGGPRANDSDNFVDMGGMDEVIDFTLQTPSSGSSLRHRRKSGSRQHASSVPKSLKVDPLLLFDRSNLHFTSIGGQGKFGIVSRGIMGQPDGSHREVIVRSLSAEKKSESEVTSFFEDLLKYHDIGSENVLNLLGIDYEHPPFLAIFEDGIIGDLKTFLMEKVDEGTEAYVKEELLIPFCRDIVSGLKFWHQNFTLPLDFGARTCQVTSTFQIKIGDTGNSRIIQADDYVDIYKLMNKEPQDIKDERIFPIRWLSPEILQGLRGGKISSFVTRQNNIWNLGMTFWEILTFGQQPYPLLSNRQVFFGSSTSKLETTMNFENSTFFRIEEKVIHDLTLKCLQIDPRTRSDIFVFDTFLTNFALTDHDLRSQEYSSIWNAAFS